MSTVQEPLIYRFGDFTLDVENRVLCRGTDRVELNARYFDALVLLVRAGGSLVEKDRFFGEVWGDVVVSDGALTQCIKAVRQALGDDATRPRYVETVPRHGYRFVAAVTVEASPSEAPPSETDAGRRPAVLPERSPALSQALATALAGTLGGAVAGLLGGLLYGFGLAYAPGGQELGTASVLLVLLSLSGVLGTVGGFGIGAGLAAVGAVPGGGTATRLAGAVLGGMLVGGTVKLLGVDAFHLLFGRTPAGITGGLEGAALGLAVALGARLGGGFEAPVWWRPVVAAVVTGAVCGGGIALAGGHLLGGSLDLLARSFADSRLQLDAIGRYFGDVRFGPTTQGVLAAVEGALFAGCVVGALVAAQRHTTSVEPMSEDRRDGGVTRGGPAGWGTHGSG